MDTMTRNQIFMENEEIITRVMRRNAPLLRALRLEWDDIYQELAVATPSTPLTPPVRRACVLTSG